MAKRDKSVVDESRISAFWSWWQGGADARALVFWPEDEFVRELTAQVRSIHPGLVWHVAYAPATGGPPTLVVGSGGDATARAAAETWLRAAPSDVNGWNFLASRPADLDALRGRLRLGGVDIDLSGVRFLVADQPGGRHDITVRHPQFTELDPNARLQVAFHALDVTLGEDLVERWIGAVDAEYTNRPGGVTPDELAQRIADDEAQRDPGTWTLVEGNFGDGDRVWKVRQDLDRFDFPAFDTHHEIVAKHRRTENGFPTPEALQKLQDEEDVLESLGDQLVDVAIVTGGRSRTVHLFSDGSGGAEAMVKSLARKLKRAATSNYDPAWTALRSLQPRG